MAQADLISIRCGSGLFCYLHYGIDIGDGTVVHLATEPNGRDISVQRVCMDEFANGTAVSIEEVVEPLAPSTVVERALAAVGKRRDDGVRRVH